MIETSRSTVWTETDEAQFYVTRIANATEATMQMLNRRRALFGLQTWTAAQLAKHYLQQLHRRHFEPGFNRMLVMALIHEKQHARQADAA